MKDKKEMKMNDEYCDYGQAEQDEQAAYEAAIDGDWKELEFQQAEMEEHEAMIESRIDELEAENARLKTLLNDALSQLEIATDLGNKRWVALNEIYMNGEKHNTDWCKQKAKEGLVKINDWGEK